MSLIADKFKSYLDEKKVRYEYFAPTEKTNEAMKISYSGDNANSISLIFFFDKDGNSVNVKSFTIAKVPADKLADMHTTLNDLNREYRWIKFYTDSDNEVTASGDAIISPETAGAECFELMLRYIDIIDEVYPRLMKILWA